MSIFSSTGPLSSRPGVHSIPAFLQQVGVGVVFVLAVDAEDVNTMKLAATRIIPANKRIRLFFFMVMVLRWDESIGENVTVNIKLFETPGKRKMINSGIGATDCQKTAMN